MKLLYIPLLLLLFLLHTKCQNQEKLFSNSSGKMLVFDSTLDSGYITKQLGLPYLILNNLTDRIDWDYVSDNDTIAKYYRKPKTDNFFICFIDLSLEYDFETHLICEITSYGELLNYKRLFHGNYSCCWNNYYDGFQKYGDFFGVDICGTGSGYCSGNIHLFRHSVEQVDLFSALKMVSFMDCELDDPTYFYKSSQYQVKQNLVKIRYSFEKSLMGYSNLIDEKTGKIYELDDLVVLEELVMDEVTIRYFYNYGHWICLDSTNLQKLDFY